jgi:copper chaperone CopZ
MKSISIMILLVITAFKMSAQEKSAEVKIKTSAVCEMCKETLEKNLAFEKGIKKSVLDVDSKVITVTYNPQKTSPAAIRNAIAKTGYDADDVPALKKAHDKLDDCCKKGAVCNDNK